ncbi:MAG TPA: sigma factor [Actinomycetota bacterium]
MRRTVGRLRGFMMRMVAVVDPETEARDFRAFFEHERVRLVRATLLLTGNVAEAEDLAQEALARVLERWDRVSEMESPDGYLYRTALNLNRKRLRRMTIAARRAIGVSDHDPLAAAEDRVDVLHAVASLPRPQREALVLVVWLGYATEEAGTLLGIEPVRFAGDCIGPGRH